MKTRLEDYRAGLLKRLRNPEYAAAYLADVLAGKDNAAFLIALKDVVEAGGGLGELSQQVTLKRPSLYRILSKTGNPTLATLQEILSPLGLRFSIAIDRNAPASASTKSARPGTARRTAKREGFGRAEIVSHN